MLPRPSQYVKEDTIGQRKPGASHGWKAAAAKASGVVAVRCSLVPVHVFVVTHRASGSWQVDAVILPCTVSSTTVSHRYPMTRSAAVFSYVRES